MVHAEQPRGGRKVAAPSLIRSESALWTNSRRLTRINRGERGVVTSVLLRPRTATHSHRNHTHTLPRRLDSEHFFLSLPPSILILFSYLCANLRRLLPFLAVHRVSPSPRIFLPSLFSPSLGAAPRLQQKLPTRLRGPGVRAEKNLSPPIRPTRTKDAISGGTANKSPRRRSIKRSLRVFSLDQRETSQAITSRFVRGLFQLRLPAPRDRT